METQMLDKSYGVHLAIEVKTETRPFDQVDNAAINHGLVERLPEKPSQSKAISRAIACLMRICMSSIDFPQWSKHSQYEVTREITRVVSGATVKVGERVETVSGRNPNYSLKVTQVKQAKTDASTTWRINIANRNKAGENMGHVLSVTYDPTHGVYFTKGTDAQAFDDFGNEVREIVTNEFQRFATNYNDEDIRKVLEAELRDMRALSVIKRQNCFIPQANVDRAKSLYMFAKECGQEVSWLGLDASEMTRDSLLADLKSSIFADMDAYDKVLDDKLNPVGLEKKRGEKQRDRMYTTAMDNIDNIMATAEYYGAIFGIMEAEIIARRDKLKNKATELLTKDWENTPTLVAADPNLAPELGTVIVNHPDSVF